MSINIRFGEFIKKECLWLGSHYRGKICKDDLISLCKEFDVKVSKYDSKNELYDKLTGYISDYEMYSRFKDKAFGIPSHFYETEFGIKPTQRKKMLSTGFITTRYHLTTNIAPGLWVEVPYVDAYQFFTMTQEEIDQWRVENIRGFKKK